MKKEPVDLMTNVPEDYLKIKTSGIIDFDKQIYLYSLNEKGQPGYDVITPFETKNNDLIILSGDYVFYNNAAVLQTNKNVYGIVINEKVNELNQRLTSIKKDEFDFIPVILKGKLQNKKEDEEGWSVKLEITEIVEIITKEK